MSSDQKGVQPTFADRDAVPVRVELVMSREWAKLTTAKETTQYFACGEVLAGIPGGKPAGAWARVIGLAFMNFCRMHPHEAMNGKIRKTRDEYLTQFTPKLAPPDEILNSVNPVRAIEYWRSALNLLVDTGFLARAGEAADAEAAGLGKDAKPLPRQKWQRAWRETPVLLVPGPILEDQIRARIEALPPQKPRELNPAKRRGRPRKRRDGEA